MRRTAITVFALTLLTAGSALAQPEWVGELLRQLDAELRGDPGLAGDGPAVTQAPGLAPSASLVIETVSIDCSKPNASINQALRKKADELVIQISGICVENVVVQRDRVTLIGTDPLTDGIQAAGNGDPLEAALLIRGARRVRVENLQLTGAVWNGLRVIRTSDGIEIVNCRLTGNAQRGADLDHAAVSFQDVVVTGNGTAAPGVVRGGLIVAESSRASCLRCTVENNPAPGSNFGVIVFAGSDMTFADSHVEGALAVIAQLNSALTLDDGTTVTATAFAIQANYQSSAFVRDTTFDGSLGATGHSSLEVLASTQSSTPFQNIIDDNASLTVDDAGIGDPPVLVPSTLAGNTSLHGFANAQVVDSSTVANLTCSGGSDVYCDGTETKGTVTGCASCP